MNIELKPYQAQAVDELVQKIKGLLQTGVSGEVCVFQAPTGSGKTVMTAKFIEGLIKEIPDDICFLWMSIGKGNLHIQSKERLEQIYQGSPRVSLIEDEFSGGRERIVRNEIVVANWEKIRNRDKDTGDWSNLSMREGENTNFREVLEKTREQRKIILIIDESHVSAATERANELRELIGADVILEMSATPRLMPTLLDVARGSAGYVRVEPQDVIEEGMIKKEVLINEGIDKVSESSPDSQIAVLEAAYSKRIELEELYKENKAKIRPLVLIQIPTSEAGDTKIEAIKNFLDTKGVSEENEKLAIWLSEQKSRTIEEITSPASPVEFLIFKQAIDTGWDCPRAQILVKFREVHNEVFEIQTVGRILRMPEQKHYADEALNKAYIFTNLESFDVKNEDYNPNIINHLKSVRTVNYSPLRLHSYYKSRIDYGDVTASFSPVFEETSRAYFGFNKNSVKENQAALVKRGLDIEENGYSQNVIANTALNTKEFDEMHGKLSAKQYAKLSMAVNDLNALFEQIIKGNLGSFTNIKRSVPAVKSAIYAWFRRVLESDRWEEEIVKVQQIFVLEKNRIHFEKVLSQAIEAYKHVRDEEIRQRVIESEQWYDYDLPRELFFNKHADEKVEKINYAYSPAYLSVGRSAPERQFEAFLDSHQSEIEWWWKNGEKKKEYFGIKYEYASGIHTFYPDYLVQLKDGRIGFFEVKDAADRDGRTYTKAKAEALQSWLNKQERKDLLGGIVVERTKTWLLHDLSTYDWEKCENGDWSEWKELAL